MSSTPLQRSQAFLADFQRRLVAGELRTRVDLAAAIGLGAWLCFAPNLDETTLPVTLAALFFMSLLPFIVNHTDHHTYARNTLLLGQIIVHGTGLLLAPGQDWLEIAVAGTLVLGNVVLLQGINSQSLWAALGGMVWLPVSQLLNDEVDFSTNFLIPLALYGGSAAIVWASTQNSPSPIKRTKIPTLSTQETIEVHSIGLTLLTEQLGETVHELDKAANTIHNITIQQTTRANQQAKAVEDVNTIVRDFRGLAQQVRGRAEYMTSTAQQAVEVSDQGRQTIEAALDRMRHTHESVAMVGHTIAQLALHLRRIGEIIASVSDIATQSNFLALNAQIEAARAGERGRGFTVVADEVRGLADQSRQATNDVRSVLKEIQQAVSEAVDVTESGAVGVTVGLNQAEEAGQIMAQLYETIAASNTAAEAILEALDRQTEGMGRLGSALQSIDQSVVQNQASSRMAENISQNLGRLSSKLLTALVQTEASMTAVQDATQEGR